MSDQERKDFEVWAIDQPRVAAEDDCFEHDRRSPDRYASGTVQSLWLAYQAGAARAALAQQAVPEKWKMVPVEPTPEMVSAFSREWHRPYESTMASSIAAMLAAAPAAPAAPQAKQQAVPQIDSEMLDFITEHRVAVSPEFEGCWDASRYDEEADPVAVFSGSTPREAISAAMAADRQSTKKTGCELGCTEGCKAREHGCASECPALPWQPSHQAEQQDEFPEYAVEINRLRNVIQAACSGGLDHMIERWKVLFPDAPVPTVRAAQHDAGAAAAGHEAAAGNLSALVDEAQQILADLHQYAIDLQEDTLGGRSERGEVPIMDLAEDWLAARPDLEPQQPQLAAPQAEQQADKQAAFEAWLENYPIQIAGDDYELCFDAFQAGLAAQQAEREPLSQAAQDVLDERRRQISDEGWTPEHDDDHHPGALPLAAGMYAIYGNVAYYGPGNPPDDWPWAASWWKPAANHRRNLVKAGALILAEIERLDRTHGVGKDGA